MSQSKLLTEGYRRDCIRDCIREYYGPMGVVQEDTRSLDYSSNHGDKGWGGHGFRVYGSGLKGSGL